jgi:hypothetical protein
VERDWEMDRRGSAAREEKERHTGLGEMREGRALDLDRERLREREIERKPKLLLLYKPDRS